MLWIRNKNIYIYTICLALLCVQRFIFSFNYYPSVDDWFLYLGRSIELSEGTAFLDIATRPFAGLLDYFVIAPMSNHLVVVEVFLMAMLVMSSTLFLRAFFPNGKCHDALFIIVITMLPLSFEGLYWISAAARIIPSLFFMSLSLYALRKYTVDTKPINSYIYIYISAGILAVGFYEIFIPVYITASGIIILEKRRNYYLILVPIILSILMLGYYMFNSSDVTISERLTFVDLKDLPNHIDYALRQYTDMLKNGYHLFKGSFIDGVAGIRLHPLKGILILTLSALLGILSRQEKPKQTYRWAIYATLLIINGIAINLVIAFVRVPFRLIAPMLIGIAILVKIAGSYLPKVPYKLMVTVVALIFSICNIGSLTLYKYTNQRDTEFVNELTSKYDVAHTTQHTYIINAPQYWYNDRVIQHEYVKAVTENFASLMGMVQYTEDVALDRQILCLHEGNSIGAFTPGTFDAQFLYYNGQGLEKCKLEPVTNGFDVITELDDTVGHIGVANNVFTYTNN